LCKSCLSNEKQKKGQFWRGSNGKAEEKKQKKGLCTPKVKYNEKNKKNFFT